MQTDSTAPIIPSLVPSCVDTTLSSVYKVDLLDDSSLHPQSLRSYSTCKFWPLKMVTVIFTETSVDIYSMTRRRVEDDFNLYKHHCNNLHNVPYQRGKYQYYKKLPQQDGSKSTRLVTGM